MSPDGECRPVASGTQNLSPKFLQPLPEENMIPVRLANYVNQNNIDLVLLAGDLFDSAASYRGRERTVKCVLFLQGFIKGK